MKPIRTLLLALLLFTPLTLRSQSFLIPGIPNQGLFMGGLGLSVIDDTTYVSLNFRPEIAVGKVGIGLDIPLRFNTTTGDLRKQDWDETYDFFRIIRYVRYGYKGDPFYSRIGTLDAARLGHGFIMNFYRNEINYDQRKIGLALDVDAGQFGFESMTNNLGRAEIFGVRSYYRPLYPMQIPILHNFALGGTYVIDIDPDQSRRTHDDVAVFGFDVELPIIKTSVVKTLLYGDWAKIRSHGSGQAVGVELTLRGIGGIFNFVAQLERRFLGKEFLPAYFNPFYEKERFQMLNGLPVRKQETLSSIQQTTRGTYGLLYGSVLGTVEVLGTFERQDAVPNSGILNIQARIPDAVPAISARASYNRTGIDSFSDAFKLDNRSVARLGIGYKVYPFLIVYLD
ncbi:MAG: hypothetical protein D6814_06755, partial [Calditrichaeota bacterium]